MLRRRRVPVSLTDLPRFAPGDLVTFIKPMTTPCWTDEVYENGEWRDEPLRIYEGTPAIVLKARIVDDDHISGECNPEESQLECYVVYDLLVNGTKSYGWQEEALERA